MVKRETERLLSIRREDERLVLEEERIRSNIFDLLSENEFQRQINIEDEVQQIKPKDLTHEIERMLNEEHDYYSSSDLSGVK